MPVKLSPLYIASQSHIVIYQFQLIYLLAPYSFHPLHLNRNKNMDTHLFICVTEEEELRTSFIEEEEEEEKERGTLGDLGGGRMEQ